MSELLGSSDSVVRYLVLLVICIIDGVPWIMIVLVLGVNSVTINSFWIVLLIVIVLLLLWQFFTTVPITAELPCGPGPALLVGEAPLAAPLAVVGLGTAPLPAALGQLG